MTTGEFHHVCGGKTSLSLKERLGQTFMIWRKRT